MVTGWVTAATIRRRLSNANANGICSPSAKPLAAATDQLPVATAPAPASATARALPASQALNSTSGWPRTCKEWNSRAFSFCGVTPISRESSGESLDADRRTQRAILVRGLVPEPCGPPCARQSADASRGGSGLVRCLRGGVGLLQLRCAFVAAHLDGLPADTHLDRGVVQFVVAGSTGSLAHVGSPSKREEKPSRAVSRMRGPGRKVVDPGWGGSSRPQAVSGGCRKL